MTDYRKINKLRQKSMKQQALNYGPAIKEMLQNGSSIAEVAERYAFAEKTVRNYRDVYLQHSGEAKPLSAKEKSADLKHLAWQMKKEGLNATQIAQKLGTKPGTVRSWLSRWSEDKDDQHSGQSASRKVSHSTPSERPLEASESQTLPERPEKATKPREVPKNPNQSTSSTKVIRRKVKKVAEKPSEPVSQDFDPTDRVEVAKHLEAVYGIAKPQTLHLLNDGVSPDALSRYVAVNGKLPERGVTGWML